MLMALVAPLSAEPLTPEVLLESSNSQYPAIIRALAARAEVSGEALAAQGEFDLVFDADGFSRLGGFYDGTAVEGTLKQRLRSTGATLYTGYKLSNGSFPVYEDENFTNTGGAFKIGMLFSLLRDRNIDKQRFSVLDASLALEAADLDVLLTRVGVQQAALQAYWKWVVAGRKLRVYENLLRLATDRQSALEEQHRRGAIARIFLTENQQNILRRRTLVTSAQRELAVNANALSLFYRNDEGEPLVPSEDQLPPGGQLSEIGNQPINESEALARAGALRPELRLLSNTIERELNRIRLQENELQPKLDVGLEVQRGIGAIAEGGASRDRTDTIVGLTFSVPLQRRAARGKLDAARARLDNRLVEQRFREEQITAEVRNLIVDLQVSRELLSLAAQEVTQAEILRAAEVRRFESGASDFFLVNIREEVAADARVKLLNAEFTARVARANFDAATMNLEGLGLDAGLAQNAAVPAR